MVLPAPCAQILLQRDSGLLAVTCDDLVLRIVDIETRRIVREMSGFGGNILDIVRGSFQSGTVFSEFFSRLSHLTLDG